MVTPAHKLNTCLGGGIADTLVSETSGREVVGVQLSLGARETQWVYGGMGPCIPVKDAAGDRNPLDSLGR